MNTTQNRMRSLPRNLECAGLTALFPRPGLTGRNTAYRATPKKSGVKPPHSKHGTALLVVTMLAVGGGVTFGAVTPAPLVYGENFEGWADATSLTNAAFTANGWAAPAEVAVRANFHNGSNAVTFAAQTAASNLVASVSNISNVWTEVFLYQTNRVPDDWPLTGNTNLTVEFALTASGYVRVYDPVSGMATNYTTDHWGTSIAGFITSPWNRLTLNQNYQTRKVALFLNSHLICEQVPFINANQAVHGFYSVWNCGVAETAGFDDFSRGTNAPVSLAGVDLDGDGMDEAQEIQAYGNVERWIGTRSVTDVYPTIQAAVAAALNGERIVVAAGTYVESLVISNGVSLLGTNVTVNGGLSLQTGLTLNVQGMSNWMVNGTVSVATNSTLVLSNGNVTFTTLSVATSGTVSVVNGSVTANGVTRYGTFTLDHSWGSITPSVAPWTESFESYGAGTMVSALGHKGWGASHAGVTVKAGAGTLGGQGMELGRDPGGNSTVISNTVDAAAGVAANTTNLWLSLDLSQTDRVPSDWPVPVPVDSSMSFSAYMNSDGYVVAYNAGISGWDVCSNDVQGSNVAARLPGAWVHLDVNLNYGLHRAAVFLDGQLIRQQVLFNNTGHQSCGLIAFSYDVAATAPDIDNVGLTTGIPVTATNGVLSDLDHDGIADALEIAQKGIIFDAPMLVAPTVTAIDTNGATLGAGVTNDGGVAVTSWGTVWDTNHNPTAHAVTFLGSTNAPFSFTTNQTGFSPGQHYYVRGWASNAMGIAYSTNGEFYAEPMQAANLTNINVAAGTFSISWTADASSTGTVVLIRQGAAVDAAPADGSNYNANASFGDGATFLGASNYIVYAGFGGTNVMVNNLVYGVPYHVAAFAYAGSGSLIQYRTNTPPVCVLVWPPQGSVFKIR